MVKSLRERLVQSFWDMVEIVPFLASRFDDLKTRQSMAGNGMVNAIKNDNFARIKRYYRDLPDDVKKTFVWKERSYLHMAVERGCVDIVGFLLDKGANPNKLDQKWGKGTPLLCAVIAGHAQIVKMLIDAGAELDYRDQSGRTALRYAQFRCDTQMVSDLLVAGANSNLKDKYGLTFWNYPIHEQGMLDVVKPYAPAEIQQKISLYHVPVVLEQKICDQTVFVAQTDTRQRQKG